jgi:hypothetical protein
LLEFQKVFQRVVAIHKQLDHCRGRYQDVQLAAALVGASIQFINIRVATLASMLALQRELQFMRPVLA